MNRINMAIVMIALFSLSLPLPASADVKLWWVDTSGSMNKEGRLESAKDVVMGEIANAKPGDVLYIGHFDTNDYLLGHLAVGEAGSNEEKERIINAVRSLSAKGHWTNLDEPLQASKAILLEERAPGSRKIVILSDGLSDPSPDHQTVDLSAIAEIVPQALGWSVYLIGLSEDIEGLFQAKSPEKELTVNEQYPHVKGIALNDFTHEKIEEAVDTVKKDAEETAAKDAPVPQEAEATVPALWPAVLIALLLGAVSVPLLVIHKKKTRKKLALVFEVRGADGESKDIQVVIEEGEKKTFGPKGAVAIESGNIELPPVLFNLHWLKERLWLLPQESITVNGKLADARVAIGIGDIIKVRGDKVSINIKEGGNDNVTD